MITKVASIYFAPVTASRNYRGNAYQIPAVPLNGEPKVIECRDLVQRDWGPMLPGTSKRQEYRWMVAGEEIARCIVGEWTGSTTVGLGMNPDRHPGIWIVRENLPVTEKTGKIINEEMTYEERLVLDAENKQLYRPATTEERERMWLEDLTAARNADRAYAEWCWNDGNRIFKGRERGEAVPSEVPPLYKLAARQYGLDAEWLKQAASNNSMDCPACGKLTSKSTFVCGFCAQPTDLERWAKFMARKEAALLDAQTSPHVSGAALPPGPRGISNKAQAQV